jgi:hypothetical protein
MLGCIHREKCLLIPLLQPLILFDGKEDVARPSISRDDDRLIKREIAELREL